MSWITHLGMGSLFFTCSHIALASCLPQKIYITRHGEKRIEQNNPDPELSSQGHLRAQRIAQLFKQKKIDYLFSTPYKRTTQTLHPLSQASGIPITEYNPKESLKFVTHLKTDFCNKTLFIAGHSNTVPTMLQALGLSFTVSIGEYQFKSPPQIILSENEFGQIFAIQYKGNQPTLNILSSDSPIM